MSISAISRRYNALCHIYDYVFSALLNPGRNKVVQAVNESGASRVLEVGVGTGLSLPLYRPYVQVTGVDISPRMLERARMRCERHGLKRVTLMQMDAENLQFADHSFDAVVALYVLSTTANPDRMMQELQRVCKPGGRIFVLNHFSGKSGIMHAIERLLLPITERIGWKSYFSRSRVMHPRLRLTRATRTNLFGYWELLEFEGR